MRLLKTSQLKCILMQRLAVALLSINEQLEMELWGLF